MSPKFGNLLGSFGLIILVQSLFNPSFFIAYALFFSMFMSFVRIRIVTLPRWLTRAHFRFFDTHWSKTDQLWARRQQSLR